jgi:hypothetical protein
VPKLYSDHERDIWCCNKTEWLLDFIGIAFTGKGLWRGRYELLKQLQDLHINVALLSESQLKPHDMFFIPNYRFYLTESFPGRKDIPHNNADVCSMCDTYT